MVEPSIVQQQKHNSKSWDNICANPFDSSIEEGRRQGASAGLRAGYNEGYHLGKMKAVEIGFELGFIRGFMNSIDKNIPSVTEKSRKDRIQKGLVGLEQAVNDFPSPEEMFHILTKGIADQDVENVDEEERIVEKLESEADFVESLQEEAPGDALGQSRVVDVTRELQRIRAKFKLLLVQLKMPHLELKKFLKENTRSPTFDAAEDKAMPKKEKIDLIIEDTASINVSTDW